MKHDKTEVEGLKVPCNLICFTTKEYQNKIPPEAATGDVL